MNCQRIAILALLGIACFGSNAPAQEKPKAEKGIPAMTAVVAGQETYRGYCATCHGMDGKGNGPTAASLKKQPPDLTHLTKRYGGKFPSSLVSSVIRGNDFITDHGTRGMPIWGDAFRTVNHDETMVELKIQNLTIYLESIQQR